MSTPASEFRYPCDSCGASLVFSPGEQSLKCHYCGHVQQIGPDAAPRDPAGGGALQRGTGHKAHLLREVPLEQGIAADSSSDLTQDLRLLSCPNCGARFEIDSAGHATTCPFCATPVVTDTGPTRQLKPQGVLPFTVTEKQAHAALENWMGRLWFAPSGLVAYARRGRRMAGIYSPFWTFDADTESRYSGARGDWYHETQWVTRTVNGKTQRVRQQVRKTRWTPVSGRVGRAFDDVLVPASSALPRRMADGLVPWDLSHLRDYDPQFLAGFGAEGYTIPLSAGHEVARRDMAAVIAADIRRDIGGDEQRVTQARTTYSAETFKHVLLPVWSAAYRYNGRSYRFVVNGQSGRVQGERPWSVWKLGAAILAALIALALMLYLAQDGGYVRLGDGGTPGGFPLGEEYIIHDHQPSGRNRP